MEKHIVDTTKVNTLNGVSVIKKNNNKISLTNACKTQLVKKNIYKSKRQVKTHLYMVVDYL